MPPAHTGLEIEVTRRWRPIIGVVALRKIQAHGENRDFIFRALAFEESNAYLEAEQWFTWLREELSAQLIRWDEIGPPNAIALPSVGSIEARLEGQITLDVAARPRFEVDREKMIELVQGANIYDGPEYAVREIIQNAIDATLLRFSYDTQASGAPRPTNLESSGEAAVQSVNSPSLHRQGLRLRRVFRLTGLQGIERSR